MEEGRVKTYEKAVLAPFVQEVSVYRNAVWFGQILADECSDGVEVFGFTVDAEPDVSWRVWIDGGDGGRGRSLSLSLSLGRCLVTDLVRFQPALEERLLFV